jgi:hypothetical protein
MMKSLARNKANLETFLEWNFLSVVQDNSQYTEGAISVYSISGKCISELCQTIISSKINDNDESDEWSNLDESSLLLLVHGFKDHMKDLEVTFSNFSVNNSDKR